MVFNSLAPTWNIGGANDIESKMKLVIVCFDTNLYGIPIQKRKFV